MATSKLPEVPSNLPSPTTGVRDDVYDIMEVFVGPRRWSRNADGTPTGLLASDEILSVTEGWRPVGLTAALKRIKNIPQWERGLASKPELKAEWDAYFALLPKWIENVYTRLDEKNHLIGADDDASDESREINWMKQRLSALQTAIDFAAQEALAPPPEPKFAPAQSAEVKTAIETLDKEVQNARGKLTEISSRQGATEPGPKLKDVFKAFRDYVKQWDATKPNFMTVAQVPTEATKKALAGFVAEGEAAWSLDNPGKPAPPPPPASSAPPKASEAKSGATAAAPAAGISTTTLWATAGALGLGALYLASRKR